MGSLPRTSASLADNLTNSRTLSQGGGGTVQADRAVSVSRVASGRQANLAGAHGDVPRPAEMCSQEVLPPAGDTCGCSDRPRTLPRAMPQLVSSAPQPGTHSCTPCV